MACLCEFQRSPLVRARISLIAQVTPLLPRRWPPQVLTLLPLRSWPLPHPLRLSRYNIYLAEIAPAQLRGKIVGSSVIWSASGVTCGQLANYFIKQRTDG